MSPWQRRRVVPERHTDSETNGERTGNEGGAREERGRNERGTREKRGKNEGETSEERARNERGTKEDRVWLDLNDKGHH